MIAIDTNVLLRHVLQDDEVQSPLASRLIETHARVLLTDVVLVECIWTLSGKKYQASRKDIAALVTALLSDPAILFESPRAVWAALDDFQASHSGKDENGRRLKLPDFADALVVHKARETARRQKEVLSAVYSFDKGVLRLTGARSP